MTFALFSRIRETSTTTGTGDLLLAGAVTDHATFSSKYANGDTMFVGVALGTDWEEFLGTYNSGANSITRTRMLRSSNADAAVSWTGGSKDVFVCLPGPSDLAGSDKAAFLLQGLGLARVGGLGIPMFNGTVVASRAGNAETIAIKTLAGNDPSPADPVFFVFRDSTLATGDYVVVAATAALSVTIPSGQAVGFNNGEPGRLYLLAINNAGTVELAVEKFFSTTNNQIFAYDESSLLATTAIAAAPSAGVAYSTTARSSPSVAWRGLGTLEYNLATAGTWVTAPSKIQLLGPGSQRPGDLVQSVRTDTGAVATGTTLIPHDDTVPQNTEGDQYMSRAITPFSTSNLLRISAQASLANSAGNNQTMALFQDAVASALTADHFFVSISNAFGMLTMLWTILAATISSTTFKIRSGGTLAGTTTFNGQVGARTFGGILNSFMEVQEIMT